MSKISYKIKNESFDSVLEIKREIKEFQNNFKDEIQTFEIDCIEITNIENGKQLKIKLDITTAVVFVEKLNKLINKK